MTGPEILKYYRSQSLGQYIPLLEAHARYPIFKDSVHQVCSLPPLINGASSKLTLQTRNVLVECTGTDWPRLCTVLTLVVTLFSTYTVPQGWIEPMHVFHLMDMPSEQTVTPLFKSLSFQVPLHEVRSVLGIPHLSLSTMQHELIRMGYSMALSSLDSMEKKQKDTSHEAASPTVEVHVPVTRPDVLHVRDVIEDVGIAYGYGRLLEESGVVLPQTMTVGQANPLNQLSAHVRHCMAQAGYMEVLSSTLCEWVPSFDHPYFGQPVTLANPSTITFQTVRTSLIPTLLSVFQEHPHCPLPLKLFEVGDAVRQHPDMEVLSCNVRKLTFAIMHTVSMVQTVHGTLEFIMQQWFPDQPYQLVPSALCVAPTTPTTTNCTTPHFSSKDREKKEDLSVSPLFFQDRGVDIWVQNSHVGVMGVIHPHLLKLWHLHFPITLVEINVEPFL
ncbi:hypothetical protein HMI55_000048 [Coelomomyces lativittatus]|nr:hypothetical protein HMI56_001761 [Coelomomyces lativittatus]KAJ1509252.1 hypothetical protein HMI55_000048 [Coelomomyces lativittatus]